MKLNALFVPTSNSGVTYWRMWNFYNAAYRQGIANMPVIWWQKDLHESCPWERDVHYIETLYRRTKELQDWALQSDVVIFGMLHGPGIKILNENYDGSDYTTQSMAVFLGLKDLFKDRFPEKLIFSEIDDNMLSTPSYNPVADMYAPESEMRELALTQFKQSDGLIVSTPYLKEIYSEIQPNCYVIPNAIDFKLWNSAVNSRKKSKNGIRIGWAGGANHEDDLKILTKVIPMIISKHKNVKFVFIHGCPHYLRDLPGVIFKEKWTDIDKYPKMLANQDFDIGIAPLEDNAFNRGKSNLRWLEYSALGIPTVASDVGNFKETIINAHDGFLAQNAEQFIGQLDNLIKDKGLRRRIGLNAQERIKKDFNVNKISQDYVSILQSAIDERRKNLNIEVLA